VRRWLIDFGEHLASRWVLLLLLGAFLYGSLRHGVEAVELATTDAEDCPAVVDRNGGRAVDFECSPTGDRSKDSAVRTLAVACLMFGSAAVVLLWFGLHDARHGPAGTGGPTQRPLDGPEA